MRSCNLQLCEWSVSSLGNIIKHFPVVLSDAGHWAVVREGLTNPWIPDNWSWGGVASEHCPVLAEFYLEKDWNRKEVTRNGNGVTVERKDSHTKHER